MKNLYFLSLAVLLWGCSTFEEEVLPDQGDSPRQLSVSAVEEPGPDPGSLEIMRRAVDSVAAHSGVRSRSASVSGAQIEPTHRYVRFSPATKAQFDALFDQDEFTCYNFPLDEVSPVSADEGFRMSGPSDTPEQLYAVLRTTVVLPDTIASEVLKELYDPSVTERGVADPAWADRVWAEARALIDDGRHPGEIIPYIPSGEIKVWDNIAGDYIPIEGVMVTIMPPDNLLRVLTTRTDKDGKFRMSGSVQEPVNYALSWNTVYWTIKSSALSSANLQGPNMNSTWDVRIKKGTVMLGPATVYRAAYRYWHKMPALGLSKPNLGRKVRITCQNVKDIQYYENGAWITFGGLFHPNVSQESDPDIEVACKRDASRVFGTAAHEIGHAAHYSYNKSYYGKVNKFVKESWARFAEYIATECEYKDLGLSDKLHTIKTKEISYGGRISVLSFVAPDEYNRQEWVMNNSDGTKRLYSPLFIDLYDNFNQFKWYSEYQLLFGPNPYVVPISEMIEILRGMYPDDDICIPNINEIQEIAFGSKNKEEAIGWIRQYAARHGYGTQVVDRFWSVFSKIEREDSYD
ncbi:hypothetical protein [Alistipes putredinis]|uniref:hypothetical protein n=1 Tax=Alistipes putredinis TaxID=28117 RepID=UPI00242FA1C9|nr:hypothetical protein [Alistipes putredinis]MBS6652360.1 hypothetical protein [Alistipes putredinis]